jgi:hypothetical protein
VPDSEELLVEQGGVKGPAVVSHQGGPLGHPDHLRHQLPEIRGVLGLLIRDSVHGRGRRWDRDFRVHQAVEPILFRVPFG